MKTPERRLLAVLKWFLASLRGQQYAGRDPTDGVKKPLNAFLGEIFLGEVGADGEECHLVSEQVSHHPPVTACYLWNEKHGVRAEGFTRQEITFNGSVNIQQVGHAVLHLDEFDEDYLIPLPNVKVQGILTGGPYPELHGSYSIVSSAGLVAEVDFSGKKLLGMGGKRNHVHAAIYQADDKSRSRPLYTADGGWTESFSTMDSNGKTIETYDTASAPSAEFRTLPLSEQDPWESRKAWAGTIASIHRGDMQGVVDNKSELENAQRELRKIPSLDEKSWKAIFFRREKSNPTAEKLLAVVGQKFDPEETCGVWVFDPEQATRLKRPYRGSLTPYGRDEISVNGV